jgi:MGT family glycosyltransferase
VTRVLFACWPFEGHVLPNLSIATALRDRGAEVAFYTAESAHPTIEGQRLRAYPFDRLDPAWRRLQERERELGGARQSLRAMREIFTERLIDTIPAQVADLEAVIDDFSPDVLVTDLTMYGPAVVLWESAPIPVALTCPLMGAMIPGAEVALPGAGLTPPRSQAGRTVAQGVRRVADLAAAKVRGRIDAVRAEHGLAPMGCSINEFTARLPLYCVMSLPELDHRRRDLPPSVHYVGACVWHPPEPPGTAQWLERVDAGRPWVHVTEGTSHHREPFLLRAAAAGLAGAPVEAILTTGSGRTAGEVRDPVSLGLVDAPNVHVTSWLGHDALLPRCAAVVTTGGAGTTMAALRAGVPLVIVPTTWDKPANARRVVAAGAGVKLSPRRCTPQALRAAVEQVLGDPAYRSNAQRLAKELAAAPGPGGAAELIENMVSTGAPEAAPLGVSAPVRTP